MPIFMRPFKFLLAICLCSIPAAYGESQAPLPQLRQNGDVKQLYVDGKPYIMLASPWGIVLWRVRRSRQCQRAAPGTEMAGVFCFRPERLEQLDAPDLA